VCVCVCVCADCVRCAPRPANKTKNPSHQAQFCFQLLISITVRIRVIFNVGVSILWLGCMHPAPVAYPTPYTAPPTPYYRVLCFYFGAALQQLLHSLQVPSLCRIHQRCVRHCKFCFEAAITPRVSNSACLCDEGRDNLRTLRVRGWSGLEK